MKVLTYLSTPRQIVASRLASRNLILPIQADEKVWEYTIWRRGEWPPQLSRPYTDIENQIINGWVPLEATNINLKGHLGIASIARNCATREHRDTRKALGLSAWNPIHRSIVSYNIDRLSQEQADALGEIVRVLRVDPLYMMLFDGEKEHLLYGRNNHARLSVSGEKTEYTNFFSQLFEDSTQRITSTPPTFIDRLLGYIAGK